MRFVLDAWAVLALLQGAEPAAGRVQAVLDDERPLMSWINAAEVFYVTLRAHGEGEAIEVIADLRTKADLELPSEARVLSAARLKVTSTLGFADAFAAATALAHDAVLLTGDPELLADNAPWRSEDLRVEASVPPPEGGGAQPLEHGRGRGASSNAAETS